MPKKSHKKLLRNGKGSGKKSQRGGANRSNSKQQLSNMKGGRKIIKYKVLQNNSAQELENLVNTELQNGWALLGAAYVQAMTKEIYEVLPSSKVVVPEVKFRNKKIFSHVKGPYVKINEEERRGRSIFPGLDITITTINNGKTFKSKIKEIFNSGYLILDKIFKRFETSEFIDLPENSVVTLNIEHFQKITLSEEVTDGIEIGTKINIDYNGEESERTIKAMDINKTEIVLETPL